MWAAAGTKNGGLEAYVETQDGRFIRAAIREGGDDWGDECPQGDLEGPVFEVSSPHEFDYLTPVQRFYFDQHALESFDPRDRFVTYRKVVERWEQQGLSKEGANLLLFQEVEAGRLVSHHPVAGETRPGKSWHDYAEWPGIEDALFSLAEISAFESKYFAAPLLQPGEDGTQADYGGGHPARVEG